MEKKHPLTCECAICTNSRKASAKTDVPILIGFFVVWMAVVAALKMFGG